MMADNGSELARRIRVPSARACGGMVRLIAVRDDVLARRSLGFGLLATRLG